MIGLVTEIGGEINDKGLTMSHPTRNLVAMLAEFRRQRDWEKFHDPKNLAEAISIEAGELLELFLWKTPEQSRHLKPEELERVEEEVADILIYLVYMSEEFGIDLFDAAIKKVQVNEQKYPVETAKGSSRKYTELEQ